LSEMRQRMPFPLLGFDTDNDSVFMNETIKSCCSETGLVFTRCRPYRKNDPASVEQKNEAVVRRAAPSRSYRALVQAHVTSGVNLSQNHPFEFPYDVASACSLDPIEDAAVLGPIKAKPFGWPRKPRPALTGPARDGVRPGGRDERMLAARIEPKNGLQIQTAGFRAKSDWR
jgi:hypothetical protein